MRVELVWGANWKTMENLTVYCLDLFDEENSSIDWSPYFPSGVQFKCPPGHTFAPRKASPKSSSPICGQVVAPSPPLLASPMASRLHLQTVNRYHNQLCQHRHHCNHQKFMLYRAFRAWNWRKKHDFPKMRGGRAVWNFSKNSSTCGTFPKFHPFWRRHPPLTIKPTNISNSCRVHRVHWRCGGSKESNWICCKYFWRPRGILTKHL